MDYTSVVESYLSQVPAKQVDITFFVPCLDEEKNVASTIQTAVDACQGLVSYEVLVVDDGSKDRTFAICKELMAAHPDWPISLIKNKTNQGLGFGYLMGARYAKGKHYMLLNGDNDGPVELIRQMLGYLDQFDIVIPYRVDPRVWIRRFISSLFTRIVHVLSGTNFKYYNGGALHLTENVRGWDSPVKGYAYQAEIICGLMAQNPNRKVKEILVHYTLRQHGKTKAFKLSNFKSVGESFFRILSNRIHYALNPAGKVRTYQHV